MPPVIFLTYQLDSAQQEAEIVQEDTKNWFAHETIKLILLQMIKFFKVRESLKICKFYAAPTNKLIPPMCISAQAT